MKKAALLMVCIAGLITGCARRQYHTYIIREPAGPTPPDSSLENVRYPALYKAYSLGRRIDPHNPHVMHEAGTLYVREVPDRWNLHPNAPASVAMGPNVGPTNAAYSPLPISEELRVELNAQKQETRNLLEKAARLGKAHQDFAPAAQALTQHALKMQLRQGEIDFRLKALEEAVRGVSALTNAPTRSNPGTNVFVW